MQGVFKDVKAPNVYMREVDRSAYDNTLEQSEVDTNVVVCGFAQKGPNLEPRRFIQLNDFIATYGYPTNEAERYFYNAADEVLTKGATLIACRLPYDNNSYEHVTFCQYKVSDVLSAVQDTYPELQAAYPEITKFLAIEPKTVNNGMMPYSWWDSLVTGAQKPDKGTFIIVDTTGNKYVRDDYYKDNPGKEEPPPPPPLPRITITVNGDSESEEYDASERRFTGSFTATSDDPDFNPEKFRYTGNTTVSGTNAGEYTLTARAEDCVYDDDECEVVWIIGEPVKLEITRAVFEITIIGNSSMPVYSGTSHTVSGYVPSCQNRGFDAGRVVFTGSAKITETNAGIYTMGLESQLNRFSYDDGNVDATFTLVRDGRLEIVKANITVNIWGNKKTVFYSGEEESVSGYTFRCDSRFFDINKVLYAGEAVARGIAVGEYAMGLQIADFSYDDANVDECDFILVEDGKLTIIQSGRMVINVVGNTGTADYDGNSHQIDGYVISSNDPRYNESKVSFSGTAARAEGTNAGTYRMNLLPSDFSYDDSGISDVVFDVTDGYIQIERIDIEINIGGTESSVVYDGETHVFAGFTASSASSLFDLNKVRYNGTPLAEVNVGEYLLNMWPLNFSYNDPNFNKCTFNIEGDSRLIITPAEMRISVKGNTGSFTYDPDDAGHEYEVSGYTVSSQSAGFDESKVAYDGIAEAKGINPGTYRMNLTATGFSYNDPNFTASFAVVDGSLVIEHSNTIIYYYRNGVLQSKGINKEGVLKKSDILAVFSAAGETFDQNAVYGVRIGSGVEELEDDLFIRCANMVSASLPNGLARIGEDVFYGCTSLSSITIPDSVTSIGLGGFEYCSGLTEVHISSLDAWCRITFGGSYGYANPLHCGAHRLFLNGEEVIDLVIPDTVTEIKPQAFWGYGGRSVTIPGSVSNVGHVAFRMCRNLLSATIQDGVETIDHMAFEICDNLTTLRLGQGLKAIKELAFYECPRLTEALIPNGVSVIEYGAFERDGSLTTIAIPNTVTTIGERAFLGCPLRTVYVATGDTDRVKQLISGSGYGPDSITFIENRSLVNAAAKSAREEVKKTWTNQYLGIVPIVVSPLNALVYQTMLSVADDRFPEYNLIRELSTISDFGSTLSCRAPDEINCLSTTNFETVLSSSTVTTESVGRAAIECCFPQVTYDKMNLAALQAGGEGAEYGNGLNRTYLNQIGVVVCRMYANPNNDNRIAFDVLESFIGSLNPDAKDGVTGASIYIGDKINTASKYINFFSNIDFSDNSPAADADIVAVANQTIYSMGFFDCDTVDDISYQKSVSESLMKTFEKLDDTRSIKIDLVVDAGVSNIAQFLKQIYATGENAGKGKYDPLKDEFVERFTLDPLTNMAPYASICKQFENFCRFTRGGDCMFITDSPRPLSLIGNAKIVRPSQPMNNVRKDILPKLKYIPPMNSCFAAGYAVWFMVLDRINKVYVWVPPSVKAVGRYIYTDRVARPWYAPAGLNRGIIDNVFDVSFNPKNSEAGVLYSNSWNYAVNMTFNGVIQEGQRTFQLKATALDRVNVRRLMSEIEKRVISIARRYLYEPLSTANLVFFENDVSKYLSKVQTGEGIEEYVVIADETNNNANTIDNNELHCTVGVRPIKSIEYIFLTFVTTNQSVNVRESTMSVMRGQMQ